MDEVIKVDVALNSKTLEGGGITVEPSASPLLEVVPSCVGLAAPGGEGLSEDRGGVIMGATGGEW